MSKVAPAHKASHDESKTTLGFWIYLMTDCVMFATLFAVFAVLQNATFGSASGSELFSLNYVFLETVILLTSSFTAGLAVLMMQRRQKNHTMALLGVTFLLGLAFVGLEVHEFVSFVNEGSSWRESAYLSSFFTLVGTHGLHITAGLIWLSALMAQLWRRGFTRVTTRRVGLFSLFWHFLDIIWIFIFTFVYLRGSL